MIYEMFSEKMLILAFNAHFSIIALVFRIFAYYYLLLCTTNERTKKKRLFIFFLTELVNLVNRVMNRTIRKYRIEAFLKILILMSKTPKLQERLSALIEAIKVSEKK